MKQHRTFKALCALGLTLALTAATLVGCGQASPAPAAEPVSLAAGGTLILSVNPEIGVEYDNAGTVTGVTARNDDALSIISSCQGLIGQPTREAVSQLVTAIGEAGYFVEEVEGNPRQITIEIEAGSALPYDAFLEDVVTDVRSCVNSNKWTSSVEVQGASDYGMTDYIDTDYGPGNDGVTDYGDTDYGPNNDGVTDYNDTDYGPNNDGVTDYNDTDYGPDNDGVTDYGDTDYGPNNDGVTDYNDTDYGPNNDGVTDYNDTDYGPNNDGVTDYNDTDYGPDNDGITDYHNSDYGTSGSTDYQSGSSNYDDGGSSNYESGGHSDYDDSGSSDYDDGSSDYDD